MGAYRSLAVVCLGLHLLAHTATAQQKAVSVAEQDGDLPVYPLSAFNPAFPIAVEEVPAGGPALPPAQPDVIRLPLKTEQVSYSDSPKHRKLQQTSGAPAVAPAPSARASAPSAAAPSVEAAPAPGPGSAKRAAAGRTPPSLIWPSFTALDDPHDIPLPSIPAAIASKIDSLDPHNTRKLKQLKFLPWMDSRGSFQSFAGAFPRIFRPEADIDAQPAEDAWVPIAKQNALAKEKAVPAAAPAAATGSAPAPKSAPAAAGAPEAAPVKTSATAPPLPPVKSNAASAKRPSLGDAIRAAVDETLSKDGSQPATDASSAPAPAPGAAQAGSTPAPGPAAVSAHAPAAAAAAASAPAARAIVGGRQLLMTSQPHGHDLSYEALMRLLQDKTAVEPEEPEQETPSAQAPAQAAAAFAASTAPAPAPHAAKPHAKHGKATAAASAHAPSAAKKPRARTPRALFPAAEAPAPSAGAVKTGRGLLAAEELSEDQKKTKALYQAEADAGMDHLFPADGPIPDELLPRVPTRFDGPKFQSTDGLSEEQMRLKNLYQAEADAGFMTLTPAEGPIPFELMPRMPTRFDGRKLQTASTAHEETALKSLISLFGAPEAVSTPAPAPGPAAFPSLESNPRRQLRMTTDGHEMNAFDDLIALYSGPELERPGAVSPVAAPQAAAAAALGPGEITGQPRGRGLRSAEHEDEALKSLFAAFGDAAATAPAPEVAASPNLAPAASAPSLLPRLFLGMNQKHHRHLQQHSVLGKFPSAAFDPASQLAPEIAPEASKPAAVKAARNRALLQSEIADILLPEEEYSDVYQFADGGFPIGVEVIAPIPEAESPQSAQEAAVAAEPSPSVA